MNKIIGALLLATPFVVILLVVGITIGFDAVVVGLGLTMLTLGIFWLGAYFLNKDEK